MIFGKIEFTFALPIISNIIITHKRNNIMLQLKAIYFQFLSFQVTVHWQNDYTWMVINFLSHILI